MRDLTLHEKITLKGIIGRKTPLSLLTVNTSFVTFIFPRLYGCSVAKYGKFISSPG